MEVENVVDVPQHDELFASANPVMQHADTQIQEEKQRRYQERLMALAESAFGGNRPLPSFLQYNAQHGRIVLSPDHLLQFVDMDKFYRGNFIPFNFESPFFKLLTPQELNSIKTKFSLDALIPFPVPVPVFYMLFKGNYRPNLVQSEQMGIVQCNKMIEAVDADLKKKSLLMTKSEAKKQRTQSKLAKAKIRNSIKTHEENITYLQNRAERDSFFADKMEFQKQISFDPFVCSIEVLITYAQFTQLFNHIWHNAETEEERKVFQQSLSKLIANHDDRVNRAAKKMFAFIDADENLNIIKERVNNLGEYASQGRPVMLEYFNDQDRELARHVADVFIPYMYEYTITCIRSYELLFLEFFGFTKDLTMEQKKSMLTTLEPFVDTSLISDELGDVIYKDFVSSCASKNMYFGPLFHTSLARRKEEKKQFYNCISPFLSGQFVEYMLISGLGDPSHASFVTKNATPSMETQEQTPEQQQQTMETETSEKQEFPEQERKFGKIFLSQDCDETANSATEDEDVNMG